MNRNGHSSPISSSVRVYSVSVMRLFIVSEMSPTVQSCAQVGLVDVKFSKVVIVSVVTTSGLRINVERDM